MSDDIAGADEALIHFLYQAPIGLVQTALDGDIAMMNPMCAQLLMPLAADGHLTNLFDALATLAPQLRDLALGATRPGSVICDALRLPLPVGSGRDAGATTLSLKLLRLDEASLMGTLSDVTGTVQREQQQLAAQLHIATHVDKLTAMPNRLGLLKRIDSELGRMQDDEGHRLALLVLNADRFERINVTLGRVVGDAVLRLMAARIQSLPQRTAARAVTHDGWTSARLEGDEFAILLSLSQLADAASDLAAAAVEALGKPYLIGDSEVHLTVSAGWVVPTSAPRHAEAVLEDASLALREAKRMGGARHCVFDAHMRDRAVHRGNLEAELRRGLDEKQLFVMYQPIVDLQDGAEVAGMEALVRWQHPERGLVSPTEFVAIAEETGLIGLLGQWVLTEACGQLVSWQRTLGNLAPRAMSVNLSRAQIVERTIVDIVRRALACTGLDAKCLQLEVTESLAGQEPALLATLGELKALGVTLALDDFGTGYSSLSSLHLMPIDVIKIDRSFVSESVTSAHHRVLVEAVSKIARSLGMQTVAEGIETGEQADLMQQLCCDKGQGYWYSRPMASADATAWLAARGT